MLKRSTTVTKYVFSRQFPSLAIMTTKLLTYLLSLLSTTLAHPGPPDLFPNLPLPVRTIAQLDAVPSWLENIAVRSNGDLLVTQLSPAPALLTIKGPSSANATSPITILTAGTTQHVYHTV